MASNKGPPRLPYALVVFIFGVVFASVDFKSRRSNAHVLKLWHPHPVKPTWLDVRTGAVDAGLGQLPLTALNSVVAVTHLAAELLPSVPTPSEASIGLSVALMNAISCPLGAMPTCHGSGGLAAQVKFGARSGASIIFLGAVKLVAGLFLEDQWLVDILRSFPKAFLGVMVVAAGIELAGVGASLNSSARDLCVDAGDQHDGKSLRKPNDTEAKQRWTTMMFTVAGVLAFKNDAVGFIAGLACHASFQATLWYREWRGRNVVLSAEQDDALSAERANLMER
ncbi:MAG: hypothetical protein Q9159_004060 [Coniocarpon cinnabarinum]